DATGAALAALVSGNGLSATWTSPGTLTVTRTGTGLVITSAALVEHEVSGSATVTVLRAAEIIVNGPVGEGQTWSVTLDGTYTASFEAVDTGNSSTAYTEGDVRSD